MVCYFRTTKECWTRKTLMISDFKNFCYTFKTLSRYLNKCFLSKLAMKFTDPVKGPLKMYHCTAKWWSSFFFDVKCGTTSANNNLPFLFEDHMKLGFTDVMLFRVNWAWQSIPADLLSKYFLIIFMLKISSLLIYDKIAHSLSWVFWE